MTDRKKKHKLFLNKQVISRIGEGSMKSLLETKAAWTNIGSENWSLGCDCSARYPDDTLCERKKRKKE
jgi:hypothetical protein